MFRIVKRENQRHRHVEPDLERTASDHTYPDRHLFRSGGVYPDSNYGNLITEKTFSAESTWSTVATTGAREVNTCYGVANQPAGCTSDTYYTFPLWTKVSPATGVTLQTTRSYDYLCGAQSGETDPNNVTTTASYDAFCRLSKVVKPGDSTNYPTLQIVYYDAYYQSYGEPFMVDFHQRVTAGQNQTYSQRKFYNGLGQLIQVQTPRAELTSGTKDVIIDYTYNAYGQPAKETVPYELPEWTSGQSATPWRGQQLSQPSTRTTYDVLGRALTVTATNGTTVLQENRYYPLKTLSIDGRGNATKQVLDGRGRVHQVIPLNAINESSPINPNVTYEYDDLDRLWTATRNGLTTIMTYDYLGNKLTLDDPDMGVWSYSYNALGELVKQVDAKHQVIEMSYDALGRMTWKSSTTPSYVDTFDSKNTSAFVWPEASKHTVPHADSGNNVARTHGTDMDYSASFYRSSYNLTSGDAIQVRFKVSDTDTNAHFSIEANNGTYRRFGVVAGSNLQAQYNNGSGYAYATLLSTLQADTWYVLQIRLNDNSGFTVSAFKESDPSVYGEYTYSMAAGQSWRFRHWVYRDYAFLDDYQEFTSPSVYTYDAYNTSQTQYGRGRRTGMSDASGSTTWRYDQRGRLWYESKAISGSGTFVTQWGFGSADQVTWMKYPGGNASQVGEQVNFSYTPQMSVDAVTGSNTYVSDSKYDAAGRLATRTQGAGLVQTNTYFDWMTANGWGRLQRMTTGSLQDLYYTYDANANIMTIRDYKAGNPQTQSFSYDNLDRLHTAAASGGTGGVGNYVSQTYDYSTSSGNLSSKAGLTLSYGYSDHPHAVSAYNGNTYSYDANGNQKSRSVSSILYNLTYDLENRLVAAGSGYVGQYIYDGDGKRVKETGVYKNLASGIVATCDVSIGNADVVTNGDTYADSGLGTSREFGNVGSGLHYVQIDLGAVYSVNKVKVWHYNRDGRTYHNTKTQVSSDGVSWYTVFDSAASGEYAETSAGKTHSFTSRSVRYVRDWLNGSTANTGNHWVEIEAWGYASTAYVGDYFEWRRTP